MQIFLILGTFNVLIQRMEVTTILNVCQKETKTEPLKALELKTENINNHFTNDILNPSGKENVMPIIPIGKVYLITNLINNKKYVGVTTRSLKERWSEHTSKKNDNRLITKAILKYGKENFGFELIKEFFNITENKLLEKETFYIEKYDTLVPRGYNLVRHSDGKLIVNEKTKKKLSIKCRGKKNGMFGKHHSEGMKRKSSDRVKKYQSGKNHPFFGKHHTKKSKIKISKSLKGKLVRSKSGKFNPLIRTLQNKYSKKFFIGTQWDFRKRYKTDVGETSRLFNGISKSIYGWFLIDA